MTSGDRDILVRHARTYGACASYSCSIVDALALDEDAPLTAADVRQLGHHVREYRERSAQAVAVLDGVLLRRGLIERSLLETS